MQARRRAARLAWLATLARRPRRPTRWTRSPRPQGSRSPRPDVLGGLGHAPLLAFLVATYVAWGAGLRVSLQANWACSSRTGASTNALSKAGLRPGPAPRRRASSGSPRGAGYVLTELAKEAPYYPGAFGAALVTDSVSANDALIFLARREPRRRAPTSTGSRAPRRRSWAGGKCAARARRPSGEPARPGSATTPHERIGLAQRPSTRRPAGPRAGPADPLRTRTARPARRAAPSSLCPRARSATSITAWPGRRCSACSAATATRW